MLRKVLALLVLSCAAYAVEPRLVADMPIPTPQGKKISLRTYRGKVVLMMIISTSCADCIKSVQMVNRLQKEMGPKGFQAIAAAGDENAQYLVEPFAQRYGLTFPVGYLNMNEMIRLADMPKDKRPVAPIFMFIDQRGTVRFQYYGDHPFFKTAEGSTRSIIDGLLNKLPERK